MGIHGQSVIAAAVGNTRTRLGRFDGTDLVDPVSITNTDFEGTLRAIHKAAEGVHEPPVVMTSVNDLVADRLTRELEDRHGQRVLRVGRDLPVPMRHALDDASTLGQDRLVSAFGAYRRAEQACVIVDAGTAVTVDFVDGEGTFQGGVIAPGLNLMLRALHEHTAQLPELAYAEPDPARGPFGKDTRHAMLLGVRSAVKGLVRETVERYAEAYQGYPQIVATGGDAGVLFAHDDLIEQIVPDLQLIGILEVCRAAWGDDGVEDDADDAEA
jgi:type III pantothenate kinase